MMSQEAMQELMFAQKAMDIIRQLMLLFLLMLQVSAKLYNIFQLIECEINRGYCMVANRYEFYVRVGRVRNCAFLVANATKNFALATRFP